MSQILAASDLNGGPAQGQTGSRDIQSVLESMQRKYTERNPQSLALFNDTLNYMPGANTRSVIHVLPFPIVMSGGQSTTLFSVDGHSYTDFLGEYSAGIYGHSCESIKQAIVGALDKGWNLGAKNEYEGKLAKILVERFGNGMDMIRFCNSGTEANLMALGAAVNFTGKRKILVFLGGYHGSSISFPEASPKYSMNPNYEFVVAPYNDISGTDAVISTIPSNSLAAIIVEGMQGAAGCIPGRIDFLQHLRKVATDNNALLILDEVMTSRLAYRGLQERVGITPDITTLGKWPGGGMSFGAFGGRRDVMEMFDPRNAKLVHSGTFNNNVVSMAAGIVGCAILNEATIERLNALGDTLRRRIAATIEMHLCSKQAGTAVSAPKMYVTGIGSLLNITFTGQEKNALQAIFYHYMLERGLYIATRGYVALNIEITDEHVEAFVKAIQGFLVEYHDALV